MPTCLAPDSVPEKSQFLRAGQRAAAVMSLIHSARLNGHDVYGYMKDVLKRLPSQPASRSSELFPHRWTPANNFCP